MSTLELGTLQAELGAALGAGFTPVTVTGSYTIDGQAASGAVTFTLTQALANAGVIIPCSPLIVELDTAGDLNAILVATDDPGTNPPGVWYGVTEQVTGAQPRDYFIQVTAAGPNPLQLSPPATLPWL